MFVSASALLLAAASSQATSDITPVSLATTPNVVHLGDASYDWTLQQARRATGSQYADSTANCSTATIETNSNGKTDEVHDCGFD